MTLDTDREFILKVDDEREITITPTKDGATVCVLIMDPHSIAVVELTRTEMVDLIAGLSGALGPDGSG